MAAGHAQINASNFHIGHLLGFDDRLPNVFLGHRRIGDLALAHATRTRLSQTNNVQRVIGRQLADDGANLGRADFEADDDRGGRVKHASSFGAGVWEFWAWAWAPKRPPAIRPECYCSQ